MSVTVETRGKTESALDEHIPDSSVDETRVVVVDYESDGVGIGGHLAWVGEGEEQRVVEWVSRKGERVSGKGKTVLLRNTDCQEATSGL